MKMKPRVEIVSTGAMMPYGNDICSIKDKVQSNDKILTNKFNKIKDFNFYTNNYKTKTYIDRSSQICVHAVGQLFESKDHKKCYDLGLMTVSKYACLESGTKYLNQIKTLKNPWFASPMQFTHSICNMPNSLSCIEFGINGITNHFFGGSYASLYAIWQAMVSLRDEMVDEMIVCAFDSVSDEHIRLIEIEERSHEIIYSEAAISMKLRLKSDDTNDVNGLCEILGVGFARDKNIKNAFKNAIVNSLKDSNIDSKDVNFFVSDSYLTNDFYTFEKGTLNDTLYEGIPVFMPKRFFGESFSASMLTSLSMIVNFTKCDLPFRCINNLNNSYDGKIHKGDIAIFAGYNKMGNAAAICIKIGG